MSPRPMTQLDSPLSVANNLVTLSKTFKSSDPVQSTAFKKSFKAQSKNDLVRSVVYLMEVVGSRDAQFKALQEENKDLKELLKVNGIDPDKEEEGNPQNVDAEDLTIKEQALQIPDEDAPTIA